MIGAEVRINRGEFFYVNNCLISVTPSGQVNFTGDVPENLYIENYGDAVEASTCPAGAAWIWEEH